MNKDGVLTAEQMEALTRKVKLIVDGKPVEIEGAPITILTGDGQTNITPDDDDIVEINPEMTIRTAQDLMRDGNWGWLRITPLFRELWALMWGETETPQDLTAAPLGMQHTAGLFVMMVGTIKAGKRPFLKLPETYLHPKQAVGLGDVIIRLAMIRPNIQETNDGDA